MLLHALGPSYRFSRANQSKRQLVPVLRPLQRTLVLLPSLFFFHRTLIM